MTIAEKNEAIKRYLVGADTVKSAVNGAPANALDYRPLPDAWTIAEQVHRLFDSEINGYVRYRMAVAEPGSTIMPYDQEAWAERLSYGSQDMEVSRQGFSLLRRIVSNHLRAIVDRNWTVYSFFHPENGTVTLEQWIDIYVDHVKAHMGYIERNLRMFGDQ